MTLLQLLFLHQRHVHHRHLVDKPITVEAVAIIIGLALLIYLSDTFFRLVWTLVTSALPEVAEVGSARQWFLIARVLAILVVAGESFRLCVLAPIDPVVRGATAPLFALFAVVLLLQAHYFMLHMESTAYARQESNVKASRGMQPALQTIPTAIFSPDRLVVRELT